MDFYLCFRKMRYIASKKHTIFIEQNNSNTRHYLGRMTSTIFIEQNNSNTRHYLGRMTRRTKIVSRSIEMLDATMKLWVVVAEFQNYEVLRDLFLAIYKSKLSISHCIATPVSLIGHHKGWSNHFHYNLSESTYPKNT